MLLQSSGRNLLRLVSLRKAFQLVRMHQSSKMAHKATVDARSLNGGSGYKEGRITGSVVIPDNFTGYPIESFCVPKTYRPYIDRLLVPGGMVEDRIEKLAMDIHQAYRTDDMYIICLLKGGFKFFNVLLDKLQKIRRFSESDIKPIFMEFLRAKSYHNDASSGQVSLEGLENLTDLRGKNVLIVEDIIDTGTTMQMVLPLLHGQRPNKLLVAALFVKRTPQTTAEGAYKPDYVGFEVPNHFVVGYNFDYNQHFRDLDHVCIINDHGKAKFSTTKS